MKLSLNVKKLLNIVFGIILGIFGGIALIEYLRRKNKWW